MALMAFFDIFKAEVLFFLPVDYQYCQGCSQTKVTGVLVLCCCPNSRKAEGYPLSDNKSFGKYFQETLSLVVELESSILTPLLLFSSFNGHIRRVGSAVRVNHFLIEQCNNPVCL